jgi:hypothetical protein
VAIEPDSICTPQKSNVFDWIPSELVRALKLVPPEVHINNCKLEVASVVPTVFPTIDGKVVEIE